jgi:midasin (ATPase involved in ribosome maturation)
MLVSETEPASLIGQYLPSDGDRQTAVQWRDGVVTEAHVQGKWILLDNISEAQPALLERINPVLEKPSCLVLSEKGGVSPVEDAPGYQLLATMSNRARHSGTSSQVS